MKKKQKYFVLLLALSLVNVTAYSQRSDSLAIKEAALNYVEGFYNSDTVRIAKAVHPELAKRIIMKNNNGLMLSNMSAKQLIAAAKRYKRSNTKNPDQPFKGDVIIYDIYGKIATAKVITNKFNFIDYIQLGKFGDEWKIVNVLWDVEQK